MDNAIMLKFIEDFATDLAKAAVSLSFFLIFVAIDVGMTAPSSVVLKGGKVGLKQWLHPSMFKLAKEQ